MPRLPIWLTVAIYLIGFILFRQTHAEVWPRDGETYVIFPADMKILYIVWRPLAYLDSAVAGMRYHIGPHPE